MLDPVARSPGPKEGRVLTRAVTSYPDFGLATQVLSGLALLAALQFHLLGSLLAGLLVYQLVHLLAPGRDSTIVHRRTGKIVVVALLAVLVIGGIAAAILGLAALLS